MYPLQQTRTSAKDARAVPHHIIRGKHIESAWVNELSHYYFLDNFYLGLPELKSHAAVERKKGGYHFVLNLIEPVVHKQKEEYLRAYQEALKEAKYSESFRYQAPILYPLKRGQIVAGKLEDYAYARLTNPQLFMHAWLHSVNELFSNMTEVIYYKNPKTLLENIFPEDIPLKELKFLEYPPEFLDYSRGIDTSHPYFQEQEWFSKNAHAVLTPVGHALVDAVFFKTPQGTWQLKPKWTVDRGRVLAILMKSMQSVTRRWMQRLEATPDAAFPSMREINEALIQDLISRLQ